MVVDCVMYSGEFEALLVRLHELAGVVDYHILTESLETFSGQPKPLDYAARDRDRLGDLAGRVLPAVALLPKTDDPWQREAYQRNFAARLLDGRPADTVVLIGDVDEIPRASAVRLAAEMLDEHNPQIAFEMSHRIYFANVECYTTKWRGTQAVRLDWLRQVTAQGVRDMRNNTPYITNAGWHFTSLLGEGGLQRFKDKLAGFSHASEVQPFMDDDHLQRCIAETRDISGRTDILFAVKEPSEDNLPSWLWAHRQDYPALWYPGSKL